jgi:hypothetical protein
MPLRELIASKMYPGGQVKASEVFVSDGSKCDIGRLQVMFGKGITAAVQVKLDSRTVVCASRIFLSPQRT